MSLQTNKTARPGSIIRADIPAGRGRHGQEWKEVRAKVVFVTPTHLTCRIIGTSGAQPIVVDAYKLEKW